VLKMKSSKKEVASTRITKSSQDTAVAKFLTAHAVPLSARRLRQHGKMHRIRGPPHEQCGVLATTRSVAKKRCLF
jgi:predicted RNA-binding Zn ribbon-like protein